jgi:hypothetical protein
MGSGAQTLATACRTSLLGCAFQLVLAIAFALACFYVGTLVMEVVGLVGVSTVPPGIRYG